MDLIAAIILFSHATNYNSRFTNYADRFFHSAMDMIYNLFSLMSYHTAQ